MLRIFFGNITLVFSSATACSGPENYTFDGIVSNGLQNFLRSLDPQGEKRTLHICTPSPENSLSTLCKLLVYIPAAGGLVQNPDKEILFIFRNQKWDLPKGKPEGKENMEQTALREVEEECGVSGLKILATLPSTWHLYPLDEHQFAIKQSFWFHMSAPTTRKLIPQTQEGITDVRWIAMPVPSFVLHNAFLSIRHLVEYFQRNKLG